MQKCELAAANNWNSFDLSTPSLGRPRIGYQDVLNDTNYGTGLYIWSAFTPLKARYDFTRAQQAEGS
jgi:hypothetical protein